MKVKDLIAFLAQADPEAEVVMSSDSEGNGYSPLADADLTAVYVPETTYSGDVYFMDWGADGSCKSPEEWEEIVASPRCVVLSPTN